MYNHMLLSWGEYDKSPCNPLSCMLSNACTSTHGNTPWRWAWCDSHRVVQCTPPACIHVNRTLLYQNDSIYHMYFHSDTAFQCCFLFNVVFFSQKPPLFLSPHATCTVLATCSVFLYLIVCVHQTLRLANFSFSLENWAFEFLCFKASVKNV